MTAQAVTFSTNERGQICCDLADRNHIANSELHLPQLSPNATHIYFLILSFPLRSRHHTIIMKHPKEKHISSMREKCTMSPLIQTDSGDQHLRLWRSVRHGTGKVASFPKHIKGIFFLLTEFIKIKEYKLYQRLKTITNKLISMSKYRNVFFTCPVM